MNKLGKFAAACAAVVCAFGAQGATCTFTDGAWDTTPSSAEDEIVVASGNLTWGATMPPKVKSWTQTGGTVTFQTVFPGQGDFQLFEVTGDVSLTGGTWTHTKNGNTEQYRLCAKVGGNFTIGTDAQVSAYGKGFNNKGWGGPVAGSSGTYGRAHGGRGYHQNKHKTVCYGSVVEPERIGSGMCAQLAAGGAIRIVVGGTLTVNGSVDADGDEYQSNGSLYSYWSGTGGSVWLTADKFAGAGRISADAGWCTDNYQGGGGRISLIQTGEAADISAFTGKFSAVGGRRGADLAPRCAPGTVYWEVATDTHGRGTLLVDAGNPGSDVQDIYKTDIYLADQIETFAPTNIILRNHAVVVLTGAGAGDETLALPSAIDIGDTSRLEIDGKLTLDASGATFVKDDTTQQGQLIVNTGSSLELPAACSVEGVLFKLVAGSFLEGGVLALGTNGGISTVADTELRLTTLTLADGSSSTVNGATTLTGDLVIKDGATLSHSANGSSEAYRLDLTVGGDMTIEKGGAVDVSDRGYGFKAGPGLGQLYYGSSHGGRSYKTKESEVATGEVYGSIVYPFTLGSGICQNDAAGQRNGGGAAKLTVAGTLTVNGSILAYGCRNNVYYNASGGSIWITAKALVGTDQDALISASASERTKAFNYNLSGGGRVAIHLTGANADFSGYAGSVTAYGTKSSASQPYYGGAGTVYLKTGSQAANEGTLIIDNGLAAGVTGGVTEISPAVMDTEVGSVIVRNGGRLKLLADQRLTVRGDLDAPTAAVVTESNAGLVFAGSGTSHVYSNLTVSAFICQAPGKEIVFGDGTTLTIAAGGRFQVEGDTEQSVTLRSTTAETPWFLAVDATAAQSVGQVSVSDCDAQGGAKISAVNSTLTRTENWKNSTIIVGQTVTWTGGAGSSAWLAAGNWDAERAPLATDRIVIAPAPVSPVLSDDFTVMGLTVQSGAAFDLNGRTLTVTENVEVHGALTTARGGTISVRGTADFSGGKVDSHWLELVLAGDGKAVQTFAGGGCGFFRVTVVPNAAGTTVTEGFTAKYLACETDQAFALSFAPGVKVAVDAYLTLKGADLTLGSTVSGQTWELEVKGVKDVSGVTASDNTGWDFRAPVVWTGAKDAKFTTPENWSTGAVPGVDDDVIIGVGTVAASAAVMVGTLKLEDGATLTSDAGLSVSGTLYLATGATLTHSANGNAGGKRLIATVGGDFVVEDGATVDVSCMGYPAARGPNWASGDAGGTYGGRGIATASEQTENKTYGSILWPTDLGAGGNGHPGGGAAVFTVAGTALVDASITAKGRGTDTDPLGYIYYSGAGGSVSLKAAELLGSGELAADGGDYRDNYSGAGGRIAVILTGEDASFADFDGTFHAYSGLKISSFPYTRIGSPGTVYLETPADGTGKGRVYIRSTTDAVASGNTPSWVDYPVLRLSPSPKEAKDATFELENLLYLNLVADAVMGDLYIKGTKPKIYLNGHTLRIRTDRHDIFDADEEARWAAQIVPGVDADGNPGKIIWKQGLMLIVR